ncbi:MAG: ribosome small subunit-dependent GTPase A [Planctomycetota bacterium]|nr:ribosome small subunit-dependent GTPase A [Planctomycetota bacterium]
MPRKKNQKKIRTQFRQKYDERTRQNDLTRDFADADQADDLLEQRERISGKGRLARKRTVRGEEIETAEGTDILLEVDETRSQSGLVISVHGLNSFVESSDGRLFQCATRKLLKTLSTDQRHIVVAGDQVQFIPASDHSDTGLIVRIEPRFGTISRTSRNRQHVIAANIDQMIVMGSAAMPDLKPHLIDRFLVTAEKSGIHPIICINKIDLVDPSKLQPLLGVYAQIGYQTHAVSAVEGWNIPRIRNLLEDKRTVVVGQSGVGKSSLLNAIQPGLGLRVAAVSAENQKGKHTTTSAKLIKLENGGYIVDTPGVRQFELWDVIADEVAGFFLELRPFAAKCRYPNCTHTHEQDCSVKNAVADGELDMRRYESFCQIQQDCGTPTSSK